MMDLEGFRRTKRWNDMVCRGSEITVITKAVDVTGAA
jgi:hypothetical protein